MDEPKDIPVTVNFGKRIGTIDKIDEDGTVHMTIDMASLTENEKNWIFGSVSGLSFGFNQKE